MTHWHLGYGLPGYGPEANDGFYTATDIGKHLSDEISSELRRESEVLISAMGLHSDDVEKAREESNYTTEFQALREFYDASRLSDDLDIKSLNFAASRGDAPMYKDNPQAWEETVLKMIGETFPLDLSTSSRMYVWECEFPNECQHITFECKHCPRDVSRDGEGGWIDDGHNSKCDDGRAHEGDVTDQS